MNPKTFRIQSGEPPDDVTTLRQFLEWRRREDERMWQAAFDALADFLANASDGKQHDRDDMH